MAVFLIWLDEDGKEIKRKHKGRGRPPSGAVKRDDGNWYLSASPKKTEANGEVEVEKPKPRKRQRRITARQAVSVEQFAKACHVLGKEQDERHVRLITPIISGKTGLIELDEIPGSPLFHSIEIDLQAGSVAVWDVTAPESPCLIIEDAIEKGTSYAN
jgi:hypothetical protein